MRRALATLAPAVLALAVLAPLNLARRGGADGASLVELVGAPGTVEGLRIADVDGDGVKDLLLVEGRALSIFAGRRGGMPAPQPCWKVGLPADVSFVDVSPDRRPSLLLAGRNGVRRLALADAGAGEETPIEGAEPVAWADPARATFTDFFRDGKGLLLPTEAGWRFEPVEGPAVDLPVPRYRSVTAPGQFLEDTCAVADGLPDVFVGAPWPGMPPGSPATLWTLAGRRLVARFAGHVVDYDLSFLPSTGDRRLLDMDGDGRPEMLHRDGNNHEGRYGFFAAPPVAIEEGKAATTPGPDVRPPIAFARLSGYQMDPVFVDLDGDGRRDFVVTSIEVDAANTVKALASGKVTAQTRAFLNRRRGGVEKLFAIEPDASVASDVGVKARFGYAGNIDIERSFTILVDGDYDGDGRKDLAIRTGPAALRIRRGSPSGVWEKEGREVAIPPMGASLNVDAWAVDMTGDRKDEIVLVYRAPPKGKDRVFLLRP